MPGFLVVILKKEEGGVGAGISIPIMKVNVSLSSPGDKSMPHVSGNIAAFHSDLSLDKPKHFLKSHHWDQLTDSLILFTGAVPQAILRVSFIGFIRCAAGCCSAVDLLLQAPGTLGLQAVVCMDVLRLIFSPL